MKLSNSKPSMGLLLAIWLGVFALSINVFAADAKIYPGLMCQSVEPDDRNLIIRKHGDVRNISELRSFEVTCPIVRDTTTNVNGIRRVSVRVFRSLTTSTPARCVLRSVRSHGQHVAMDTQSFAGGGRGILSLDVDKGVKSGAYYLSCVLPARSRILTYAVLEYEN